MKDPDKIERKSGCLRKRPGLSNAHIDFLTTVYSTNQKPSMRERAQLAKRLGVCVDKVRNWFQNRRARDKRVFSEYHSSRYNISEEPEPKYPAVYPNCNDLYKRRPFN